MDKQIWMMVLDRMARLPEVTPAQLEWLRRGRLVATQTPDKFILQVPGTAARKQIGQRLTGHIERAVSEALGTRHTISISIVPVQARHHAPPQADARESLFPDVAEPDVESAQSPPLTEIIPSRAARTAATDPRRARDSRDRRATYQPSANGHGTSDTYSNGPLSATRPSLSESASAELPAWLNDRYTFDTYIIGGGNQFAHAACMAVADDPGNAYNPLFLYGGSGLGKTHLMHAIAHAVVPKGYRALYVTSETFTNEIVNAIRYRTTEEFRAKYRSVDVLLVDDVQFIAGKGSTEEEFFHTFNALYESHKQIVMCSDRPPKEIDLAERLRSRFEWGLMTDIQPPDLETRLAILRVKAEASGVPISDAVLTFLAERVQTNVRQLEGLLNRVVAMTQLRKIPLTVEMAREAVMSITPSEKPRRRMSTAEILQAVSNYFRVSLDDLRGKQRDKRIVGPRHLAMWLMRTETEASLMEIGQELGGRDHSTILHGCEKIEQELQQGEPALSHDIELLRQQLVG